MELKEFLEIIADIKEVTIHLSSKENVSQAGWSVKRVRENEKISDQARVTACA